MFNINLQQQSDPQNFNFQQPQQQQPQQQHQPNPQNFNFQQPQQQHQSNPQGFNFQQPQQQQQPNPQVFNFQPTQQQQPNPQNFNFQYNNTRYENVDRENLKATTRSTRYDILSNRKHRNKRRRCDRRKNKIKRNRKYFKRICEMNIVQLIKQLNTFFDNKNQNGFTEILIDTLALIRNSIMNDSIQSDILNNIRGENIRFFFNILPIDNLRPDIVLSIISFLIRHNHYTSNNISLFIHNNVDPFIDVVFNYRNKHDFIYNSLFVISQAYYDEDDIYIKLLNNVKFVDILRYGFEFYTNQNNEVKNVENKVDTYWDKKLYCNKGVINMIVKNISLCINSIEDKRLWNFMLVDNGLICKILNTKNIIKYGYNENAINISTYFIEKSMFFGIKFDIGYFIGEEFIKIVIDILWGNVNGIVDIHHGNQDASKKPVNFLVQLSRYITMCNVANVFSHLIDNQNFINIIQNIKSTLDNVYLITPILTMLYNILLSPNLAYKIIGMVFFPNKKRAGLLEIVLDVYKRSVKFCIRREACLVIIRILRFYFENVPNELIPIIEGTDMEIAKIIIFVLGTDTEEQSNEIIMNFLSELFKGLCHPLIENAFLKNTSFCDVLKKKNSSCRIIIRKAAKECINSVIVLQNNINNNRNCF